MNSKKNTTWAARAAALGLSVAIAGGAALVAAAPAQAAPSTVTVDGSQIRSNEATYPGWHQGYDNAADHAAVTRDGLELRNGSQILYGYTEQERLTGAQLESLVEDGGISWKSSWNAAFFQLPVYYGDPSNQKFATLRPASPVEGANSASLDSQWVSSKPITDDGGTVLIDKDAPASLADLFTALDLSTVQVLGFGVLSQIGTDADVDSVSFNGTSYTFVPSGTAAITGTAAVGSTLTASASGFAAGSQLSYEWYLDGGNQGGPIVGATGSTYTVTGDIAGGRVGVIVTGTVAGHITSSVHADETDVVPFVQKPAAPAPVANSTDLPAYLASKGVTPGTPLSAGLPATLDPTKGYTASVEWTSNDSFVDVYLYSTPILLGSFPVVDGTVQVTLSADVLAKLAAGSHTLVLVGQSSGGVQAVALSVAAVTTTAALAATGDNNVVPATLAGLLVLLGAAGVFVSRRRRATQA